MLDKIFILHELISKINTRNCRNKNYGSKSMIYPLLSVGIDNASDGKLQVLTYNQCRKGNKNRIDREEVQGSEEKVEL